MRTPLLIAPPPPPAAPSPHEVYGQRMERLVKRAREDIDAFGAIVLRDNEGKPVEVAPLHKLFTNFIRYCWEPASRPVESGERDAGTFYCGILAPWRHGKTLLGPIRVPLYEIGRRNTVRIRLVCGNDREAIARVAAVRRYLSSEEYRWVFPDVRPARAADWNKHQFFVARDSLNPDPTLSAAGIFDSEAGGGNDILIFDDVATYQNMILKPGFRQQVYDTMTSVWLRRIDPNTRVLVVGTTWHADDPYQLLRQQKGGQWRWLIVGVGARFDRLSCRIE